MNNIFICFLVHLKCLLCVVAVVSANRLPSDAPSTNYGVPPTNGGYSYGDQQGSASSLDTALETDPRAALTASIPGGGTPGQDYPILASVPNTGFSCDAQEFPGYFADIAEEAGCQVFHICQFDGRHDSFLCPNGTVFNQQYFVCDWWFNVDCATSEQFFHLNAQIGKNPEDSTAEASVQSLSTAYGTPAAASDTLLSSAYGPQEAQASAQAPSTLYNTPARL
ncbi:uncharacterized protein [Cherax quadricarinatus]|uniref:uncharacterized protein n=1 Tax=Cherax quadricarinatus TaxID=27406 RepID=UPI00387ECBE1